jgi:MFS family permease
MSEETTVLSDTGTAVRKPRLAPALPRPAWVVLGGDALSAVGTGLSLPFLLVYLSQVRHLDLSVAGLAAAMIPLASFAGNPLGGWLADRAGPRNAVVAGLVVAAAGSVSVALVGEVWHAFVATGLVGLGAGLVWPAQDALLATTVDPDQRSSVFSVRHATFNAGLGVGALIAAGMVDLSRPGSFVALYLLDAASFLVFIPLLLTLPARAGTATPRPATSTPRRAGGYRQVFGDRTFRWVWGLTALVVAASYGQYHAGFPAYAARPGGISAAALGFAFAANTMTVVGAQLLVLRLVSGRRRTAILQLACGGWAAAWTLTLVAGQLGSGAGALAGFVIAMIVFGVAETLLTPTLPAIVNDLAPDDLRGRYNGAATLAWTTGFLTGPALAGVALDAGAGTMLFLALIAACATAGGATRRLERHLPPSANRI